MNTKLLLFICIMALIIGALLCILQSGRPYSGTWEGETWSGVAWDWGGIELQGDPGIFICPGNYDPATDTFTPNPLAPMFPDLVTDC